MHGREDARVDEPLAIVRAVRRRLGRKAGPVQPGDLITAEIERVGRFDIRVAAYEP